MGMRVLARTRATPRVGILGQIVTFVGDACVAHGGRCEAAGEQDAGRPKGRPYNGRFRGAIRWGVGAGIEVVVSLETERFGI
jgi:hypothetical protein